jgi:hypothetical protein
LSFVSFEHADADASNAASDAPSAGPTTDFKTRRTDGARW